jgi:branched-chain amino acid transport system substrate-binding protein
MRGRVVAGLLALALAAGCGSDDGGKKKAVGTSTTAALEGPPIVLGSIQGRGVQSVNEQNQAALKVAVDAVNAAGGIGGRPLELRVCEDDEDPNSGAACARRFAQDGEVVALVGSNSNNGETIDPVLEGANLPSVGQSMFGLADFKSPMVFPADGGSVSGIATAGPICLNLLKGEKIALAYIDVAAGAQVIAIFDAFVLKPFGTKLSVSVPIPPTAADLSSQAAKLAGDKPDCLVMATAQESSSLLLRALRQQGYKGPVVVSGNVHTERSLLDQVGKSDAEGVVLTLSYDPESGLYRQFASQMRAAGKADLISDQAAKAWLSVRIVADTLKKLTTPDRPSLLGTLQTLRYDTGGMLAGPLDYSARKPNPKVFGGAAPNLVLPYALAAQMKDGKLVLLSKEWQDPFGGPK